MSRNARTIAKNAFFNIVRGGASAIVALALPHFLTQALGHDRFAAWALMLQIAAYANYFDFGLQTAIARYLAQAIAQRDAVLQNRLLSTAFALLTAAGVLVLVGFAIVIWKFEAIFVSTPSWLLKDLRQALLVMAAAAAMMLPMSTFTGVLIGLQRNEFPALAIGGSRLCGAVAAVFVSRYSHSLLNLAICIAASNLIGAIAQYLVAKKLVPDLTLSSQFVERKMASELFRYCSTLMVWSLGMLLVSGLDVTIVGLFDFNAVGYYSIATTLVTFICGLNYSAFNAILAPVAVMQARNEHDRIGQLVIKATRLGCYMNIAATLVIICFGQMLLRFWVGAEYVTTAFPVLTILMIAQTIRLAGNPYGTVLVATGLQKYGILSALVEGVTNLSLSVAGIILFGPIGVAWATLIAACIGVAIVSSLVMRSAGIAVKGTRFLLEGILRPALAFLPTIIWLFCHFWLFHQVSTGPKLLLALVAVAGTSVYVLKDVSGMNLLTTQKA